MKKLTLALLTLVALTSCSTENDSPSLVGSWHLVIPDNQTGIDFTNETVFYETDSFSNRLYTPDTTYYDVSGGYTYLVDSGKISLSADNFSVESYVIKLTQDTLIIESLPNKRVSTFTRVKEKD